MAIQATIKAVLGLSAVALLVLSKSQDTEGSANLLLFGIGVALIAVLAAIHLLEVRTARRNPARSQKPMLDPDNLPDAVIVTDVNGHIRIINTAAKTLFDGLNIGKNIKALFDSWHANLNDRKQADQVVEAVLSSPDIQFSEFLHLNDGRMIERTTRPLEKHGHRLWLLRDITHMHLADSDSDMHRTMVEADAARTAEMAEQLYHAKAELEAKQAELTRLANTDSLTGLYNRRRFTALGEQAVANVEGNSEIWVLMMDIDHFKRVNDTYGHAAGDVAIRDFANIINSCVGEKGFVGRMGGEEFAVILPNATQGESISMAEQIRRDTAHHQTVSDDEKFRFTASIGVAQWLANEITIEPALDRADQALYSAKTYGRNRVVGFEYASN